MYYEINVAKLAPTSYYDPTPSYRHYFATAPRSISDSKTAVAVLKDFQVRFPEPEFNITLSRNPEQSEFINIPLFLSEKNS